MKITSLNMRALVECLARDRGVVRRVDASDAPHLRRCIDAGLLMSTGEREGRGWVWKLSPAGELAVAKYQAWNENEGLR
jgi:hypothetical protein